MSLKEKIEKEIAKKIMIQKIYNEYLKSHAKKNLSLAWLFYQNVPQTQSDVPTC